jgi:hypothetical protein
MADHRLAASRKPIMSAHSVQVYEELADTFDQQQNEALRDQFLLLAADAALSAGRADEAERLRQRLLWLNPHHSVRAYASFGEAAVAPGIHEYLDRLRQKYPPEQAEVLLESALPHAPPPPASDVPATLPPMPRSNLVPPTPAPPVGDASIYGVRPDEPEQPATDDPHPLKVFRGSEVSETMPPPRAPRQGERPGGRPPPRQPVPGGAPPPRRPDEPPNIAETMPPQRLQAPRRGPAEQPPPEQQPPVRRTEAPQPPLQETLPPRRGPLPEQPPRPSQLGGGGVPATAPPARAAPVPRQPPQQPPRQPQVRRTTVPPLHPVEQPLHSGSAPAGPEPDADKLAGGAWVGAALFVLVLVGGVALAVVSLMP